MTPQGGKKKRGVKPIASKIIIFAALYHLASGCTYEMTGQMLRNGIGQVPPC